MEYKSSTSLPSQMLPQKRDPCLCSLTPFSFLHREKKGKIVFVFVSFLGDAAISMNMDIFTNIYLSVCVYIHMHIYNT